MQAVSELSDDYRNEVEEIVDAGDDVVVAVIRASGRGKKSGALVGMRARAVILEDRRAIAQHQLPADEDALEAVGR